METGHDTNRRHRDSQNVVWKSQTTLSSCPFAAWFLQKQKKKEFNIHNTSSTLTLALPHHTHTHTLSDKVDLFGPTCVSWPAVQVYKAEGSFCWWGAAAPPSAGDNSSPAPSGTPSGPVRWGSCSYVGHLHTFGREVHQILAWRFCSALFDLSHNFDKHNVGIILLKLHHHFLLISRCRSCHIVSHNHKIHVKSCVQQPSSMLYHDMQRPQSIPLCEVFKAEP